MWRRTLLRSALAALALVTIFIVVTQVPLVPASSGFVPLDTALAAQFPGLRDAYRANLAPAFEPRRLPGLVLLGTLVMATLALARSGDWLTGRLPPLSKTGLALFRVAYGVATAAALYSVSPPPPLPVDLQRGEAWFAGLAIVRWLASTPGASGWLHAGALVALLVFVAGLHARLALLCAATLLSLFVGVLLNLQSTHDWNTPLLTMWLLTLVPWDARAGVRELVRAGGVLPDEPDETGFRGWALWAPGLTMGLAFAAAAFAKLDTSGLAWVTGGAVGFHFLEDAGQAPTQWGIAVASRPQLAVAASLAAVATEAFFPVVLLARRPAWRSAFGVAAVSLLLGFYLFQGVFWPAWWAMLLAFAPWSTIEQWLRRRAGHTPGTTTSIGKSRASQRSTGLSGLVCALILVQAIASLLRVESEPLYSDFGMYAYTWPSRDAFNAHLAEKSRRVEFSLPDLDAQELDTRLETIPRAADVLDAASASLLNGQPLSEAQTSQIQAVRTEYEARFHAPFTSLLVRSVNQTFDWSQGTFVTSPGVVHGRLDLEHGVLERAP